MTVAVGYAGIGRATFYRWMHRRREADCGIYREFYVAVRRALATAEAHAVAIVRRHMAKSWRRLHGLVGASPSRSLGRAPWGGRRVSAAGSPRHLAACGARRRVKARRAIGRPPGLSGEDLRAELSSPST